jgi:integrase
VIGLPAALVALLGNHRAAQQRLKAEARQLWQEGDWVFTSEIGDPLNPNSDYHRWKALLRRAGVPDGRLHDARHMAATVLLILGVPERTVMGIMGWSSTAMAARYQHITDPIRHEVAARVDGLIWSGAADDTGAAETTETKTETAR